MKHSILITTTLACLLAGPSLPAQIVRTQSDPFEPEKTADNVLLTQASGGSSAGSAPDRTLVLGKDLSDAKEISKAHEDLEIMAHILAKAAGGGSAKSRNAMGILVHDGLGGDSAGPQNLYLEGYGALFFLKVNYPLVAPASKKVEDEPKEETSTEWEEARREVEQSTPPGFAFNWPQVMSFGSAPEEYDSDKVGTLKSDLIAALKNAAHIGKLKSNETATVVVSGRSSEGESKSWVRTFPDNGGRPTKRIGRRSGEAHGGTLILQAKKADIDAFQKETLSLDEFRQKVTLTLR